MKMLLQSAPLPLRDSIISLWTLRGRPAGSYAGLPKPYIELIISLAGVHLWRAEPSSTPITYRDGWLTPLQVAPRWAETQGELHLIGARLHLLAAARLFGAAAMQAGCYPIPIDAVLGSEAALLRARLLDAGTDSERLLLFADWLSARIDGERSDWLPGRRALADMGWRTDALAEMLQLSPRALRKRFAGKLGVGPKLWLQLNRFDGLLRAGPTPGSLADAAAEFGFADQAHMTREFTRFAGVPPARYAIARAEFAAPEAAPHFVPAG